MSDSNDNPKGEDGSTLQCVILGASISPDSEGHQAELQQWSAAILARRGLVRTAVFHLIDWRHDDWCPLAPRLPFRPAAQGRPCRPSGTLIINAGVAR
jgi:hypothetical protein